MEEISANIYAIGITGSCSVKNAKMKDIDAFNYYFHGCILFENFLDRKHVRCLGIWLFLPSGKRQGS
jgi:hypothetical protein